MSTITVSLDGSSASISIPTFTPVVHKQPLGKSWLYQALPDNAALDTVNGPAAIAELVRQSKIKPPYANITKYTAEHLYVDSTVPRVPVICNAQDSYMRAMFLEGVPIPPGTQPTNDSDAALTIYQEDSSFGGTYWEMQAARYDAIANQWYCNFGGRMTDVNNRTNGTYVQWVTGPKGTQELPNWGTQGSAIPYWMGVIDEDDFLRGYVNHVIHLEVYDAAKGLHPWPAYRSDGGAVAGSAAYALQEGFRLRLPPGYQIRSDLTEAQGLVWRGARDHGFLISDRTLDCLAIRMVPSLITRVGSPGSVLFNFPWADLQLLKGGSAATPVPTA
jgi:hypothetical protein